MEEDYKTENTWEKVSAEGHELKMIIHLFSIWIKLSLLNGDLERAMFYINEIQYNILDQ